MNNNDPQVNATLDAKQPLDRRVMRRSEVETLSGMVRLTVEVQQEPDGAWVARVPVLARDVVTAPTKNGAIKAACNAVSVGA